MPCRSRQGHCGVPMHLDLYGKGALNGMEFHLPNEITVKDLEGIRVHVKLANSNQASKNYHGSLNADVNRLRNWIQETASTKLIVVNKNKIQWKSIIPKDIGEFIRSNCENLEYTVELNG